MTQVVYHSAKNPPQRSWAGSLCAERIRWRFRLLEQGFETPDGLLDLGFFIDHVLTNNRIEFLQFQFFGHGALVLGRGVEVTGACA
jgi:hypothetical protein